MGRNDGTNHASQASQTKQTTQSRSTSRLVPTIRRLAVLAVVVVSVVAVGPATPSTSAVSGRLQAAGWVPPTVYVTNSATTGVGTPNITRFAVEPDSGHVTPVEKLEAKPGVRGMVFTPDLRYAYASNAQGRSISMFRIGADGSLMSIGNLPTPEQPDGIAIAPNGGTVYVANVEADKLSAFSVQFDGALYPRGSVSSGGSIPGPLAVTPDGRFLYVTHGAPEDTQPNVVTGFALMPDGRIGEQVAKAPANISPAEAGITPDGRFMYVVHQGTGAVVGVDEEIIGYRIGANGSLTEVSRTVAGDYIEGMALSPDGGLLYAGQLDGRPGTVPVRHSTVVGFAVGSDGQLTKVAEVPLNDPIGFGFRPDGRRLYVTSFTESLLTTYAVGPSGQLTTLQTQSSGGPLPAFHSVNVLPVP